MGSARQVGVELDLDGHAGALVAASLRLASTALASDPHLHPAPVSEVAPPALALRPADVDDHPVPVLAVSDREGVSAAAPTSRDRDQRQTVAQQRM